MFKNDQKTQQKEDKTSRRGKNLMDDESEVKDQPQEETPQEEPQEQKDEDDSNQHKQY